MNYFFKTNNFKTSSIQGKISICNKRNIFFLSLQKLALFWLIAIFCVFVPVLHFFLVPAFLIIGALAFVNQYKNTHLLKTANCICPQCERPFYLERVYFYEGKKVSCTECMARLFIESDADTP